MTYGNNAQSCWFGTIYLNCEEPNKYTNNPQEKLYFAVK